MSRLESSAKNITFTIGSNIIESLLGIVSRTVFISTLGASYLGLAGLLNNVLGFLSISELGISTAVGFSLYKPLAEENFNKVSALMSLYRRAYLIISAIVFAGGIGLFFFIDFFVPSTQQPPETALAYFVFLINTVLGYLLSYKTTLLSSDNQAYRLIPIGLFMTVIQFGLQVSFLLIFKSYTVYLIILLLCSSVRMIWQNHYITQRYKYINFHSKEPLDYTTASQLKRNIGGLIIAKIGDYLVNSTDNLIITKLVSLTATGIYSNYLLIRNLVNAYISTAFSGVSASLGNIVAVESDQRKKEIFDALMLFSFFVYSFEAVCFLCLFNLFIGEIWLGEAYVFDTFTVVIIVINNYLTGLRMPLLTMKSAAGKHMEDAWIPFAFAGINLLTSIVLAKHLGVAGVFMGTIIGSLLTADWYRPIIIYRHVFHVPVIQYYGKYLKYICIGFAYMFLAYWLCSFVSFSNAWLTFLITACISAALPIGLNVLFFHQTKEFEFIKNMGYRLLSRIKHRPE